MEETESTPIVAAYFPEWGIYERNHTVSDIPAESLTNLIYAFVEIEDDFTVGLFDDWAATDYPFRDENSVDGEADIAGQGLMGNFNQLAELKAAYPHLTIQLGIGGWTLSDNFSDMAATAENRDVFTDSVIAFLKEYPMFDGIDFDWEYPGGGGLAGNTARAEDGANYVLLAQEMRAKLDALDEETSRDYTMSAAVPAGYDKIANLDAAGLAESVDFLNVMTYDFYGAWQNTTGHLAGIYDPTGAQYDVSTAIQLYLDAGVDPAKLVLGLPSYTRAWQGVYVDNPIDAWNSSSGGGAPGTYPGVEPAYYEYKDLLEELQAIDSDWGLYYDDTAQAAFLYNPTLGIFSSFETPSTIALKSEWAQSLGLGGVMFWDTSGDSNGSESLIAAAYSSWFEGLTFYEIDAASSLAFDAVYGGDGVVAPIAEADTPPQDLPAGPPAGDDTTGGGSNGDTDDDGGSSDVTSPNGTADVTRADATVVITWSWGRNAVVEDFDPASDTIFIDWFGPGEVQVSETNGDVVFAVPGNNQTVTLAGVSLADLWPANFTIVDSGLGAEILGLIGSGDNTSDDDNTGDDTTDDDTTGDGSNDDGQDTGDGSNDDNSGDSGSGGSGSDGDFEDFLDALLAFESGWDRDRYEAGIITDEQLTTWARGTVQDLFPDSGYATWSDLTDAEWEVMAYRSFNVFGFVGYQFGEALLIDLGYYDDDVYYLNGADTNTWDGTWTGKNGANSLDDFITQDVQDLAIRDAFGHNLEIIEEGLAAAGTSLGDYLGTTRVYNNNGHQISVELTLTGILAAAHLGGAPAVIELLLNGTLANDEFGTSIMQYAYQFGGYDSPTTDELIAFWIDNLTGDEGLGSNRGSANVDEFTADVIITWNYGQNDVVTNFDPATDTIWVGWLTAADIDVYEEDGSTVFAVPLNGNQTTTLQGVSLDALSLSNFTILDESAAQEILALIGSSDNTGEDGTDDDTTGDNDGDGPSDGGDDGSTGDDGDSDGPVVVTSPNGTADVTKADATVVITWAWGQNTVFDGFDPTSDSIFVDWFHSGEIQVSETDGDVILAVPGNNQTVTLAGISLADLSPANFTIMDSELGVEILSAVSPGDAGGSDDGDGSQDTGDPVGDGADDPGGDAETGGAVADGEVDVFHFSWNWAATEIVSDFAPVEDVLDFGSLPTELISISEVDGDLVIEILNSGGQAYVLEGVQAEDLTAANFTAPNWNGVLDDPNGVFDQLVALGNQEIFLA